MTSSSRETRRSRPSGRRSSPQAEDGQPPVEIPRPPGRVDKAYAKRRWASSSSSTGSPPPGRATDRGHVRHRAQRHVHVSAQGPGHGQVSSRDDHRQSALNGTDRPHDAGGESTPEEAQAPARPEVRNNADTDRYQTEADDQGAGREGDAGDKRHIEDAPSRSRKTWDGTDLDALRGPTESLISATRTSPPAPIAGGGQRPGRPPPAGGTAPGEDAAGRQGGRPRKRWPTPRSSDESKGA